MLLTNWSCFLFARNAPIDGLSCGEIRVGPRVTLMLKKLALASAFVFCMTILGGTARADNIPIANASFEAYTGTLNVPCGTGCAYNGGPIPGWSVISGGSWQPGSYFNSVPDGKLIGFVNATRSLSQTLTGNSVLANSIYTLSV